MNNFHAQIYGFKAPSSHLVPLNSDTTDEGSHWYTLESEEDDLGYYPDGNKRTLTDDQIAMFRHSEIFAILRERQVQKENREADGNEQSDAISANTQDLPTSLHGYTEVNYDIGAEEEERDIITGHLEADTEPWPTNKKRKRNSTKTEDEPDRTYTSRRIARELDSAVGEDYVLDYGDEPTGEISAPQATPAEANVEDEEQLTRRNPPIGGRKIWWPVIRAI